MRKVLIALVFIAGAAAAGSAAPAAAAGPQEGGSGSGATADESVDRVICRRRREIGSRVKQNRVCLTRAEWAKLETATRDDWNEFRRRSTAGAPR